MKNSMAEYTTGLDSLTYTSSLILGWRKRAIGHYLFVIFSFYPMAFFTARERRERATFRSHFAKTKTGRYVTEKRG